MDITKLEQKDKCILAIKLAEQAASYFPESNVKSLINEAIEVSWKWVYTGENLGEALYDFLDNEENGFTLFQEIEEDEKNINAWDCIIDAVAYVSRAAYEKEGVNYLPEPIEMVDDNIFTHMMHSLILCDDTEREYIKTVYQDIMDNLWTDLNKQIPVFLKSIIDEFQLRVIEVTEIETALIGSNYALLISIDRFYAEVDYVNRNSANELKKYRCSSFFAEKYDEKDRVSLLEEHGAKEMIANSLTVISRGLLSKWKSVLEGNIDWLETYKKSSWASEGYLHDFEIEKLNHYI